MQRERVTSSVLRTVGYDAQRQVLEIEFVNGHVYRYYRVPAAEHHDLMAAESHGSYFNRHIRDRYLCTRV